MAPVRKGSKRKAREAAITEQFSEALFGAEARVAAKPDADLFFVDNASTETKSKRARRMKIVKEKTSQGPVEVALVRKLAKEEAKMPAHHVSARVAARADRVAKKAARGGKSMPVPEEKAAAAVPTNDIWGDESDDGDDGDDDWTATRARADGFAVKPKGSGASKKQKKESTLAKKYAKKATSEALEGQSYNPSLAAQQKLVAKAVAIETKRVDKIESEKAWREERKRKQLEPTVVIPDSDSDDDDADADPMELGASFLAGQTARERLSQARRNRMKRRRQVEHEIRQKKEQKALKTDLYNLKGVEKKVNKKELADKLKKKAVEKAKIENPVVKEATEPPLVPLLDELTDNLRSNKAIKAGNVLDAMHKALADAHKPEKRAAPKKQRKVKWRGAKIINRYRKPWIQ